MLPFLKPKSQVGVIVTQRKPDGSKDEQHMEGEEDQGLMSAAEDLIRAVHAKDAKAVAEAIRAGFEILDSRDDVPQDINDEEMDE